MKKALLLLLIFVVSACSVESVERLSVEEMEKIVATYNNEQLLDLGTIYEIFPIAFADSDGDGHGDIQGIISVLDYLNDGDPSTKTDLGIGAIWLTPLYPSNSYHHYDVIDYKDIDPKFGTLEDFDQLIEECDKRGITVIMDVVFNHTAYEHEWFQKALDGDKYYQDFYHMKEELPKEDYPKRGYWYQSEDGMYYYGSFWERMPELDGDNENVRKEFKSILDFWMDRGVKGFRYDAAKHMYNSDEYPMGTPTMEMTKQFWLELEMHVKEKDENTFLVAEVWLNNTGMLPYASSFDSMFNFDVGPAIFDAIKSGRDKNFVDSYNKSMNALKTRNPNYIDVPFLTNHDQTRSIHELQLNEDYVKQAAFLYLTLPGIPMVYYGEELGMQGIKPDEQIREPMKWRSDCAIPMACWEAFSYNKDTVPVQVQTEDENSILSLYRTLIQYRSQSELLKKGELVKKNFDQTNIIAYERTFKGNTLTVIHNIGKDAITLEGIEKLAIGNKATIVAGTLLLEPNGSAIVYE